MLKALFVAGASVGVLGAYQPYDFEGSQLSKLRGYEHDHFRHVWQPAVDRVSRHFKTLQKVSNDVPAGLSDQCNAAATAFTELISTGSGSCDPAALSMEPENTADLDQFCKNGCDNKLATQVNNVLEACKSTEDADKMFNGYMASVDQVRGMASMFCIKQGDEYCMPALVASGRQASQSKGGAGLKKEQLESMCDGACVEKMIKAVNDASLPLAKAWLPALKMTCLKIDGQFCALTADVDVNGVMASFTGGDSDSMAAMCSPCTKEYLLGYSKMITSMTSATPGGNGFGQMSKALSMIFEIIPALCKKDKDGKYCLDKLQKVQGTDMDETCGKDFEEGTCSEACRTDLQNVHGSVGCCMGGIMEATQKMMSSLAGSFGDAGDAGDISKVMDGMKATANACGVPMFETCATRTAKHKVTTIIKNLKQQWVVDNMDSFTNGVTEDIAEQLGVTPGSIKNLKIVPKRGETVVEYEVEAQDDEELKRLQTAKPEDIPLDTVKTAPLNAREDISEGIKVDTKSESVGFMGEGNGSQSLRPLLVTMAALVAAVLVLM